MPALSPLKLTYEDYLHFPDDGRRHELIDGDHQVTPAPTPRHQLVLQNLFFSLEAHNRRHTLGRLAFAPLDLVLSPADVVQPDLIFIGRRRRDRVTDTHVDGAPDLVVEVLSESTRRRDEITKRHLYERFGVSEYWLVDPVLETVKVFRRPAPQAPTFGRATELSFRDQPDGHLASPLFPGLSLPLSELFSS
jgi:Uma2 family endonuclease